MAEAERATDLQRGEDVGKDRIDTRIQRGQKLRHTDRIGGRAGDTGGAGDAVSGRDAGVGLQRRRQCWRRGVSDHLTHYGQAADRRVACSVSDAQVEAVVAQHQRDAGKAEAAVGRSRGDTQHGTAASGTQREQGSCLGLPRQRHRIIRGVVVADHTAVAGRGQAKTDEHRCNAVWRQLGQLRQRRRIDVTPAHAHGGREQWSNHAAAAQQRAANDQLLQPLHQSAQLQVVTVAQHGVDRVDADVEIAVDHVTADAHTRQRACLETVGVGTGTAQRGVVTQIRTDQQVQAASRPSYLQQLQASDGQVARGVTLGHQLHQRAADIDPPRRSRACGCDAGGAAVHAPQATGDGTAYLYGGQRVAAGHTGQEQIGSQVAAGDQALQAGSIDAAGTRRGTCPGGDVDGQVGCASHQSAVGHRVGLEVHVGASRHTDRRLAHLAQGQAGHTGQESGVAGQIGITQIHGTDGAVGPDAGQ